MKLNKSLAKRVKLTKTGKLLARKSGQNHFNAKASRAKQLNGKRAITLHISNKSLSHFLPNTK